MAIEPTTPILHAFVIFSVISIPKFESKPVIALVAISPISLVPIWLTNPKAAPSNPALPPLIAASLRESGEIPFCAIVTIKPIEAPEIKPITAAPSTFKFVSNNSCPICMF